MSRRVLLLVLGLACAERGVAQTPAFDPFPGGTAAKYQFDLKRNFYPSSEAARQERAAIVSRGRTLVNEARKASTARQLHAVLAAWDSMARLTAKQYAWLTLRLEIDTRDAASTQEYNDFSGAIEPLNSELQRMLGDIPPDRFRALAAADTGLRKYAYAAQTIRRNAAHQLDSASAQVAGSIGADATTWGPALFQSNIANTSWGSIQVDGRTLDFRRNGTEMRNHRDRSVREQAYRLGNAGMESRLDVYAMILMREAQARNDLARLQKWPDYVAQTYAGNELEPDTVRKMLVALGRLAEVNKRYERSRISQLRNDYGLDTVHVWDLGAPPLGRPAPRFTVQRATAEILTAAKPLGPAYVRELGALLDPANGRLDMFPRPGRVDRPGFSTGLVGYPSMFFQGRFEGFVDDIVILAHEAAHGAQNMLMDSAGVPPRYAWGPSYFTESFAIFSQTLTLEHLARSEAFAADRDFFLRRLIEDGMGVFQNAWESRVELMVFDSVAAGRPLDPAGMERLTQTVASEYSIWFGPNSEKLYQWVQPIQLYTWPLYRVNYVLAQLLALRYLDLLHRDPEAFAAGYAALLRNGYDAPPELLLKRFLNIDFADWRELTASATAVLDKWVADYTGRKPVSGAAP